MTSDDEAKVALLKLFNEKYGSDLLDLEKCREIKKRCENRIHEIQFELTLSNSQSKFAQSVAEIEQHARDVEAVQAEVAQTLAGLSHRIEETTEVETKINEYVKQLNLLQCSLQYVKIIQCAENLSEELKTAIQQKDDEKSVTIFANLSEITRQLATSPAKHLQSYLRETTLYWHNVLKQKFSKEFLEALATIKWPFVSVNLSVEEPSEVYIRRLQLLAEYLLQIDLPEELIPPSQQTGYMSEFPRLSLPLQFMIQPLRKRFLYHFHGNRKTNRDDKPEWYFTKILSWIRDHADFVEKWIQPVADKMGFYYVDAKAELMRGLVQLAVEKLYSDLPNLQYDDFTFSHCIDEALGFDKELKENYDYSPVQPSILLVLTQAQVFMKWMAMEKKYALEKMDSMLSESHIDAFQPIDLDTEDLKVAPFAEVFITLLQTITERYETLPQPRHRLQFLDLQLELLDDFRIRLLQLINAEEGDVIESKVPIIANTIFYIENVLTDWGAMVHFLSLYHYKSQLEKTNNVNYNDSEFDSPLMDMDFDNVFAEILSLYQHMRKDLLLTLFESVMVKVKGVSRNYRREMWFQIKTPKEVRSMSLTPSACPIFEIIATKLHQLQKSLTKKLFSVAWRSIAQQTDEYFFEELVLENRFSEGGASQLKFDLTRNLFPIFSQFTDRPDSYFVRLSESCSLLNIAKGSALLLRETLLALEGATGVEDRRGQALKEIGVQQFTPKMAVTILNRRADITTNRMTVD